MGIGPGALPIRLSLIRYGLTRRKVPPNAVIPLPLPTGASAPFGNGASCSLLNRYSGWPYQVTCVRFPPMPISPIPEAGTPPLPGATTVSTEGQARRQAGVAEHLGPYRSPLKV